MSAVLKSVTPVGATNDMRTPPHSNEAEQSVLGGLLLDNSAWASCGGLLTSGDFFCYEHGLIYAAVGALISATKPADVITVFEQLQTVGKADECGGLIYLNELAQSVPSATNMRSYVEIVREHGVKRRLIAQAEAMITAAFDAKGKTAAQILGAAADTFDALTAQAVPSNCQPLTALDVHALAVMRFKIREAVLSPWLHTQDLCMVFAARGIGKTHFGIAIAYAVATGGTFAKWQAPQARKVLYLDGELPGGVMQKRLLMHCPDVEPQPGYLRIFTPDLVPEGRVLPDLSMVDGQDAIGVMIEFDTELVIVDNLSAWMRSGRENEAESWGPIAGWLLSLRRRGIAVLLIHHAGKGGQQRGTSKREDLLDVSIGLSRPKDYTPEQGAVFVAEFTKGRHLTGNSAEGLEFTLAGTDDKAEWECRTIEHSTYDRVVALTKEGLTPGEICAELDINKSNVSRHIKKAREAGDVPIDSGKKS